MKTTFPVCMALLLVTVAAVAEYITYNYDSAGRLVGANYGSGKTTTYQYDTTGNILRSADNIITDTDNDGMADSWEQSFFGDLTRNGLGDFDGDGMNDLSEFLASTLPNNTNSLLRMDRQVTSTFVQTTVSWRSVSGRTYRVQFKNTLNDPGWNDLAGDVAATGATASKTDVTTAGQAQRYYRVQVLP